MAISQNLLERLLKFPLCVNLSPAEASELFAGARDLSVPKGQVLFREGDPGDAVLFVLEGKLDVTKQNQKLGEAGEGTVLGEMVLLGASTQRSASALAATDVKLVTIPTKHLDGLLQTNNLAALKVVRNLAQVMSRRLLAMDEKVVDVLSRGQRKEELANFNNILSRWSF